MNLFGWETKRVESPAVESPGEPVKLNPESKAMWIELYKGAVNVVYEPDDLKAYGDREYATRMARAARNLADAAVEEYEERWGL